MAITLQERLLKAEHDAMNARADAFKAQANLDYVAMMADVEIPTEDGEVNEQEV